MGNFLNLLSSGAGGGGGMSVSGVLESVSAVISSVVGLITDNPVIAVFIGMSVVGGGVALFRKLMRSGKS